MPNGRTNYDPYSIRQIGIYHKYLGSDESSVWLLLRPTTAIKERLRSLLLTTNNPMSVHIILLSSTVMYWDEYLEFLEKRLEGYVSRDTCC